MTQTKSMELIDTPFKMGRPKAMKKNVRNNYLNNISTGAMVWHLVKRHKFGLVLTWAILATVTYIFPPTWDILGSLVR